MAEQKQANQDAQQAQPQVAIQKVYVRDASIEVPNGPSVFTQEFKPEINVELNSKAHELDEQNYHVQITVTVTAKQDDKTVYLVEVQQAGIFFISGFEDAQKDHVLGVYCPSTLFPYAREAIAGMTQRAGFPGFTLQPVNFEVLYQQRQAQAAEQQKAQQG